jgi:hypothetical protein
MVVEPMVEVMVDPPVVSTVTIAEVVIADEEPYSQVSHVPVFVRGYLLLLQFQ